MRHLCGPAVDDQDDDNQEAANPSDDQRCWNDMAPCPRTGSRRSIEKYGRCAKSSMTDRRFALRRTAGEAMRSCGFRITGKGSPV